MSIQPLTEDPNCCGFRDCREISHYVLESAVSVASYVTSVIALGGLGSLIVATWPVSVPVLLIVGAIDCMVCGCGVTVGSLIVIIFGVQGLAQSFFSLLALPFSIAIDLICCSERGLRVVSIPGAAKERVAIEAKPVIDGREEGFCKEYRAFFDELPPGAVFTLNEARQISFDSMLEQFKQYTVAMPQVRLGLWDSLDFEDPDLKYNLLTNPGFLTLPMGMDNGSATNRTTFYVNALLDIFCKYKEIAQEEGTLGDYRQDFTNVMAEVIGTFSDGCPRNQLCVLPRIIAETLSLHPRLLEHVGMDSAAQANFAVTLFRYQREEADRLTVKEGGDIAELEFVVMKKLGIIEARFSGFLYGESDDRVSRVVRNFTAEYYPLRFFMENLVEPADPAKLTAKFHTDMIRWYGAQGFDLDDAADRTILMTPKAANDPALGVYEFNKNAVIYFLAKNGLLRQVISEV